MSAAAGRTIREAIGIALEAVPGPPQSWTAADDQRAAVRAHVLGWVTDYARHRGVLLSERDLVDEIDEVIRDLATAGRGGGGV